MWLVSELEQFHNSEPSGGDSTYIEIENILTVKRVPGKKLANAIECMSQRNPKKLVKGVSGSASGQGYIRCKVAPGDSFIPSCVV